MFSSSRLPKHRTKEEYAYEVIRTAILHCELKPGEKIVVDGISQQLGVSPIPVRTALQRLQTEGLVEIIPHTGVVVTEISPDQIAQVFLLLEHLESAAFEVAATKATEADISSLRKVLKEMETVSGCADSEQWSELNGRFHRLVAAMTTMPQLIDFTGRVLDSWDRLRRWYLKPIVSQRIAAAMEDHRQMVALLERREVGALVKAAASHNRRARGDYEKLVRLGTIQ
jgi:DNA-binding GntR family transcriptional regulator